MSHFDQFCSARFYRCLDSSLLHFHLSGPLPSVSFCSTTFTSITVARKSTKRKRNADGTLARQTTANTTETMDDNSVDHIHLSVDEPEDDHDSDYVAVSKGEGKDGLDAIEAMPNEGVQPSEEAPAQKKSRKGMKYASKAGQQAARTIREKEAKAKKDAAINQERGIAHIQSVLCFKKVPPVTPQIIEIEDSESEPEIQCISPKRPGIEPETEPSPNTNSDDD